MIPKHPPGLCPICDRKRERQAVIAWLFIAAVAILTVLLVASLVSSRQMLAKGPVGPVVPVPRAVATPKTHTPTPPAPVVRPQEPR